MVQVGHNGGYMNSQRGSSLIQVLMAVTLTGIVSLAIFSSINAQNREIAASRELIAQMELKTRLMLTLADAGNCQAALVTAPTAAGGPLRFDARTDRLPRQAAQLTMLPESSSSTVPLVEVQNPDDGDEEIVSNFAPQLRIESIRVSNIIGSGNRYTADVQVMFDQETATRPLAPVTTRVALVTTGPTRDKTITQCLGAAGSSTTEEPEDPDRPLPPNTFKLGDVCATRTVEGITERSPDNFTSIDYSCLEFMDGRIPGATRDNLMLMHASCQGRGRLLANSTNRRTWRCEGLPYNQEGNIRTIRWHNEQGPTHVSATCCIISNE